MSEFTTTAQASMLIRKPPEEVFEAFINPDITNKFWFTQGSGRLKEGAKVIWTWEMYNLNIPVSVKKIVPNQTITIEWGDGEHLSTVIWDFKSLSDQKTYVTIINSDFKAEGDELINKIIDSTGGFTLVIAGLKAWLEHGIELNLVGDKFPQELMGG